MSTPIVEISNVTFAYNGETVLRDVSFDIRDGDFIAMIGPNGGGKTTLLKLILGLLKPDRGAIRVMGQSARKASPSIGYVPQDVNINRRFPIRGSLRHRFERPPCGTGTSRIASP